MCHKMFYTYILISPSARTTVVIVVVVIIVIDSTNLQWNVVSMLMKLSYKQNNELNETTCFVQ